MMLKTLVPLCSSGFIGICFVVGLALTAAACKNKVSVREATVQEIRAFFEKENKKVLTFAGYSGAGYEDEALMLGHAERILAEFDPAKTIVNAGATPDGIGSVYKLAKQKGFMTTGIVSTQAKQYSAELSPYVDNVFYVEDSSWGGFIEGTEKLSPTSEAMVENSDVIIGIGGGEVARDEMIVAKRLGKEVRFIPADMNHQKAVEKAQKKGLPAPTDFKGAADAVSR